MEINLNRLPKNRKLMILDFLQNPSSKRALKLLEKTPLILLVADSYISNNEIKKNLKKIVAADLDKKYIAEFLEYDICSHLDCKLNSLHFILKHGNDSNSKIAKKLNLEQKLS